ncbi:sensor histidine kinase RcsC [bacterium BMS3Bbin04]|nr:sensor histidine kinase RcsC [bacterium BMS3Bbin04]
MVNRSDVATEAPGKFPTVAGEPDHLNPEYLIKMGMLVAGIAHNMNGPLTGMLGNIDLMKMMHPELKDTLEKVGSIGMRLREDIRVMMSKTVAEGRRTASEMDIADVVNTELKFYQADQRLKHETNLILNISEDIPKFKAVRGDFWQAFSALLTNAIEAMGDKGGKTLIITLEQQGDEILLIVQDNGIGMDSETMAQAFDPLFTTKETKLEGRYPATLAMGLGLTHAKLLMDDLGVAIELQSEPKKGTTATMRIPYQEVEALYRRETR